MFNVLFRFLINLIFDLFVVALQCKTPFSRKSGWRFVKYTQTEEGEGVFRVVCERVCIPSFNQSYFNYTTYFNWQCVYVYFWNKHTNFNRIIINFQLNRTHEQHMCIQEFLTAIRKGVFVCNIAEDPVCTSIFDNIWRHFWSETRSFIYSFVCCSL